MRRAAPIVAIGLAAVLAGCGGVHGAVTPAQKPDLANGKTLFTQRCGSCHTLQEAGSKGVIGPNLDDAYVGPRSEGWNDTSFASFVRQQISQPSPPMPPNLATGKDADDIAAYVAAVAAVDAAGQAGGSTQ